MELVVPHTHSYETVAVSQTDQILGATGAVGDMLERLICVATGAAVTNTVSIKDGNGSAIPLLPTNAPAGTYVIEVRARCVNATTPGWKVTTAATVTAIGIGKFT